MWYKDQEQKINFQYEIDNKGVTGISMKCQIKRKADGKFWDGDSWETLATVLVMTEENSTTAPGHYYYLFTPTTADIYTVRYFDDSSATVDSSEDIVCMVAVPTNPLLENDSRLAPAFANNILTRQMLTNDQVQTQVGEQTFETTYDDNGEAGGVAVHTMELNSFGGNAVGDMTDTVEPAERHRI